MPYKLGMMRFFATARHGKSISAFSPTGVLLVFIQCTLYTLQGHSLIPPHFPLISLAHTHTHGSLWRTPSIPNIPIGAWHQWRLARSSLCRPLQHLRPHIHHSLMLPSKGYHHVDGPCISLPSSFIWISCTQTEDTVAITIVLYNRTRFWSHLLTYLWKSTMKSQMFVHFYTELSWWKEKSVKHILKCTISAGWCSNTSVFISNLKICLMTFHSYCFN